LKASDKTPVRKLILKGLTAREFPIGTAICIGSAEGGGIVIKDPQVEPRHAKVQRTGEHVFIEVCNLSQSVTVNGKAVRRQALRPNDEIQIGAATLVYVDDNQPEPAAGIKKLNTSQNVLKTTASTVVQAASAAKLSQTPLTMAKIPRSASVVPASGARASVKIDSGRGASAPSQSGSARLPGAGGDMQAAASAALSAQAKGASLASQTHEYEVQGRRQLIKLAAGVICVLLLAGFVISRYRGDPAAQAASEEERAAIERLKKARRKDPQDLCLLRERLLNAKKWADVAAVLGEPSFTRQGPMPVWEPERGTIDLPGEDFRGYQTTDGADPDSAPDAPVYMLLFQVFPDGRVKCLDTRAYSRVRLPPPPAPLTPPIKNHAPPAAKPPRK
jgi:hypothetical protein